MGEESSFESDVELSAAYLLSKVIDGVVSDPERYAELATSKVPRDRFLAAIMGSSIYRAHQDVAGPLLEVLSHDEISAVASTARTALALGTLVVQERTES